MSSFWNFFSDKKETEDGSTEGEEQSKEDARAGDPKEKAAAGPQRSQPPASQPQDEQEKVQVQLKAPSQAPKPMPSPKSGPRYGIDDAIKLMRTLPVDENVDLVVRVIKKTLESLAVKVPDIIDDAGRRQDALRAKIGEHKSAIAQLEREIDARRFEISRLEDDLAETTTVRERLQLAEATALQPTPSPAKVTANAGAPSVKKPDLSQSQSAKAPPLPAARPKAPTIPPVDAAPVTPVVKKGPDVPMVGGDDDEDEQPVESRDLVEK